MCAPFILLSGVWSAPPASAQSLPPGEPAADGAAESRADITVTGSRIRNNPASPVPLTVLGEADIEAERPANLSDLVNQLPSITPASTSGNSSGNLSNGLAGINSVNLRGLGVARTLVLLDGRRSVGSAISGVVDINTIPQDLVRRVEVITGGASAQYGSDAIGGVVNFVLDRVYTGAKISIDQGISTYGDGRYRRVAATVGRDFLDGRVHVILNGEYFHQYGVDTIDRPWNDRDYFQINNPNYTPTNGQPERLVGSGFAPGTYAPGGLVTAGRLAGTYFLGAGKTGQLHYGAYNPAVGPWMVGGDGAVTLSGHLGTNSLIPEETRIGVFNHTTIELGDHAQLFGQFSWNRYHGQSNYQQTPSTGVTIARDNAYLQTQYPGVAAAMAADGLASLTIGTSNAGLPVPGSDNRRDVYRGLVGVEGDTTLFGRRWTWDASYQLGITRSHEELANVWNTGRMALAQDAVLSGGRIVCRPTLTDPDNGCVPIDRLGTGGPSAQALAYIYGAEQPQRVETLWQHVASAEIQGGFADLPGGVATIAVGGEWRREQVKATADLQSRSGWLYGNYQPAKGAYEVKEGYTELSLPVLPRLSVDAAGRVTDYTTSGTVGTWKVGANWTPIDGIRLRGSYSRDIRAPNLQDLYAGATARSNTVILPSNAPVPGSVPILEQTVANPDLKPERARSWTAGAVLSPKIVPGLTVSFDYFSIDVRNAIGTLTSQNTVNLCYSGATIYCPNIIASGGTVTSVLVKPVNFASQRERGFDISAEYRVPLSAVARWMPGDFRISGTATHYISNIVDNGVFPVDYAGVNGDNSFGSLAEPSWSYRVSAFWTLDPITVNLVARGFSAGVYGNDYIECTSGCPASSVRYRTINDNHIPGATYLDASIAARLAAGRHEGRITLAVSNLLNKAPAPVGNGPDGNNWPAYAETNRLLYDVVGRVFRLSLQFGL